MMSSRTPMKPVFAASPGGSASRPKAPGGAPSSSTSSGGGVTSSSSSSSSSKKNKTPFAHGILVVSKREGRTYNKVGRIIDGRCGYYEVEFRNTNPGVASLVSNQHIRHSDLEVYHGGDPADSDAASATLSVVGGSVGGGVGYGGAQSESPRKRRKVSVSTYSPGLTAQTRNFEWDDGASASYRAADDYEPDNDTDADPDADDFGVASVAGSSAARGMAGGAGGHGGLDEDTAVASLPSSPHHAPAEDPQALAECGSDRDVLEYASVLLAYKMALQHAAAAAAAQSEARYLPPPAAAPQPSAHHVQQQLQQQLQLQQHYQHYQHLQNLQLQQHAQLLQQQAQQQLQQQPLHHHQLPLQHPHHHQAPHPILGAPAIIGGAGSAFGAGSGVASPWASRPVSASSSVATEE